MKDPVDEVIRDTVRQALQHDPDADGRTIIDAAIANALALPSVKAHRSSNRREVQPVWLEYTYDGGRVRGAYQRKFIAALIAETRREIRGRRG